MSKINKNSILNIIIDKKEVITLIVAPIVAALITSFAIVGVIPMMNVDFQDAAQLVAFSIPMIIVAYLVDTADDGPAINMYVFIGLIHFLLTQLLITLI